MSSKARSLYHPDFWQISSIRDPLYGFVDLTERELALLECYSMQRLTRIKQLSHTYLVYPGATHTRFEHSIGTLFIADRMCRRFAIDRGRREIIRAAALLHDVGHGPFSHTFEEPLSKWNNRKVTQEEITKLFLEYDPELKEPLQGSFVSVKNPKRQISLPDIYNDVLDIFRGVKAKDVLARSIVSGTIDADKFDYLIRDSFHTGTTYGIFDRERVLATLRIVKERDGVEYPVVLRKSVEALESFRLARFLLHTQVYQHKTRLIADSMFVRAVELSDDGQIDKKSLLLSKGKDFVESFKTLDDASVVHAILNGRDGSSKSLMTRLRDRKLLKQAIMLDFSQLTQSAIRKFYSDSEGTSAELEEDIADKCKVDRTLVFVHHEKEDSALKMYSEFGQVAESGDIPLLYLDERNVPRPYESISPLVMKREPMQTVHVFCPTQVRERVARLGRSQICKV